MVKIYFILMAILVFTVACGNEPVDVLVAADGTVTTGKLLSIDPGRAFLSGGTVDVPASGRVWCLDGRTFAGEITASGGTVRSGSSSVQQDSVFLIIWGDSHIIQETHAIDAALGWHDTGIALQQGEILALHTTGTVVTETGTSTPDGQDKFSSSVSLAPGATSGQLVFKIGDHGQPVAAGSEWIGESQGDGNLIIAVNVPLEGSIEPRGVYTVTVKAGTFGSRPGTVVFCPATR
ncbi:MAG: hypothetical protein KAS73_07020 [Candidatus Sabulitectum sp.]|nr:hypothetical protein [Candidatus Sabulitectum sp.]